MGLRLFTFLLATCAFSIAQDDVLREIPVFRSNVQLAVVQFHVKSYDRYVPGLTASDFELVEDGRSVPIRVFENGSLENESLPVEVILLLDSSGSVTGKRLLNEELFRTNLLEGLPGVSLSIYHFGSHLVRMTGPTRDPARIRAAFEGVIQQVPGQLSVRLGPPYGSSMIYEAVSEAIKDSARARTVSRKLVVAVSDGRQNGGSPEPRGAIQFALEYGVPIYPIVVGQRSVFGTLSDQEADKFARLGDRTGGVEFRARKLDDETVKSAISFIAERVRHLYVVGYAPSEQSPPRRRKIEVHLQPDKKGKLIGGTRFVVH